MQPNRGRCPSNDSGFGIIEVVISMFLLALLAVAFLPLLIQGLKTSVRNSTIATASQLLDQQLGAIRALESNCDDVQAYKAEAVPKETDARGTEFQPVREVAACPATYPGVVRVRVSVKVADSDDVLAEAVTVVYVESQSAPAPVPAP